MEERDQHGQEAEERDREEREGEEPREESPERETPATDSVPDEEPFDAGGSSHRGMGEAAVPGEEPL